MDTNNNYNPSTNFNNKNTSTNSNFNNKNSNTNNSINNKNNNQNSSDKYFFMNDPRIRDINPKKMAIINEFYKKSHGLTGEEMLPLFLATTKTARDLGISFTNEEITILIDIIKSGMNAKEASKIDTILNLTRLLKV